VAQENSSDELELNDELLDLTQLPNDPSLRQETRIRSDGRIGARQPQEWLEFQVTLIARCLAGDEQAFALLADHYGSLLLRTAFLLVQDEEAAKDIVQDSLLLAWKHMATLREPAFLRAWLLKIVVNQSTSLKRQWARKAALLREQFAQYALDVSIQQSDFQRGHVEDRLDVERAIEQLPIHQRTVLVLFYYHRMTVPEIALLLDTSENTLRKRLQSALDKLRRVLQVELDTTQGVALSREAINARIGIHKGGVG
jgi:RNA polymerase sigma-70 factor (ECF subfamily)